MMFIGTIQWMLSISKLCRQNFESFWDLENYRVHDNFFMVFFFVSFAKLVACLGNYYQLVWVPIGNTCILSLKGLLVFLQQVSICMYMIHVLCDCVVSDEFACFVLLLWFFFQTQGEACAQYQMLWNWWFSKVKPAYMYIVHIMCSFDITNIIILSVTLSFSF